MNENENLFYGSKFQKFENICMFICIRIIDALLSDYMFKLL